MNVTEFKHCVKELHSSLSEVYIEHEGELYELIFSGQDNTGRVIFKTDRRSGVDRRKKK